MTILLEELNAKGKCTLPIGTAAMPPSAWQQGQERGRAVLGSSAGRQLGHPLPGLSLPALLLSMLGAGG